MSRLSRRATPVAAAVASAAAVAERLRGPTVTGIAGLTASAGPTVTGIAGRSASAGPP